MTLAVFLFGLSTAISWSYYGDRAVFYLFGPRWTLPYRVVFCVMHFLGAVYSLEPFVREPQEVWDELFREKAAMRRPRPQGKRLWAEMAAAREGLLTSGSEFVFIEMAIDIQTRDPDRQRTLVCLMDGEQKLWDLQHEWLGRSVDRFCRDARQRRRALRGRALESLSSAELRAVWREVLAALAPLALGELRRLARLLEAVLLALLLARVAREESGLLERRAALGGDLDEGVDHGLGALAQARVGGIVDAGGRG